MAVNVSHHTASLNQFLHISQVEHVLAKLGHSKAPETTLEGLSQLYYSWCRKVPFDNSLWLIHLNLGYDAPVPGHTPTDFFDNWLKYGTGGLCFPAGEALHALLATLGFQTKFVLAWMPDAMHATLVVTIDGKDYFVDQSVPHSVPLLLDPGSAQLGPGWRMRLFHQDGRFHYRWLTFRSQSEEEIGCVFNRDQYIKSDNAQTISQNSKLYQQCKNWSRYNYNLNTTIYSDDQLIRIVEGERKVSISRDGVVAQSDLTEVQKTRLLVETFGISEEIVRKLPPDLPTIRQTLPIR